MAKRTCGAARGGEAGRFGACGRPASHVSFYCDYSERIGDVGQALDLCADCARDWTGVPGYVTVRAPRCADYPCCGTIVDWTMIHDAACPLSGIVETIIGTVTERHIVGCGSSGCAGGCIPPEMLPHICGRDC